MQSVSSNAVAKYLSYSETEHKTGGLFNGKPVYCKYIDLGAMPNSTTKNVRHNISNLDVKNILKLNGFFTNTSSTFQFPYRDTGSATAYLIVNSTYIIITDNTNLSSFNGYAYIEYTKTTD